LSTSGAGQEKQSRRASRRDAVRQLKRDLIRDAAKGVFAERGIDAASMREIARAAGYTTGSIYVYFATKEDLYGEVLRDTLDALNAAVVGSTDGVTSGRAEAALRGLWRFFVERPADFDLGFYLYGGARPAGLTQQLDGELNGRLDQVMRYIGTCLVVDGLASVEEAHHHAVVHATWIFGLLLMTNTGRIKAVRDAPEPLLETYFRVVKDRRSEKRRPATLGTAMTEIELATKPHLAIDPTERVSEHTERFRRFLDEDVAPLEKELAAVGVGTPAQPDKDEAGRMHPAVWEARREVQRRAGAAGLYAPHIRAEFGGRGFGRVEMHHVEEFVYRQSGLGLGLAALAWTEGPYPASERMAEPLRERYLEPLIKGEITCAFANTELGVGSDVLRMSTHAERDGSDWILNGRKGWITNAHFADVMHVVAVTDSGAGTKSLSMFMVDANMPGFQRGVDIPTMIDDGLTGELEFHDVRVPAENVVGEIGDGFALAMSCINWRRLCRGGMCAGWGQWLVDRAVRYAQQRQSGGKPIADLQSVQHMIARMDMDVYQTRATSLLAQAQIDQLGPFEMPLNHAVPRLISLMKVIIDEAFYRVADGAVQVHGGAGLRRGSPEEKLFRVARNLRIPAGTSEIQLNAIARGLLQGAPPV